ncbi:MAG: nicotinate-nucleotide adenylyltransferase [Bryobacteraceae bacterium]|jgi:nicotinate-nucleotide adenylyltransferase
MRLAIFGGTFDPIHSAHLAIARAAAERFRLDRILFVPAGRPPHKAAATHAPYGARVRMAELACGEEPRFEVSRLEEGAPRSYSIDTIEKVRESLGRSDEFFFLIGADAFAEIRTWRRWQDVARAVTFLVVSRPGHVYETPPGARLARLDTLQLRTSSSAIRAALAAGRRPAGVPERVLDYIYEHALYGAGRPVVR